MALRPFLLLLLLLAASLLIAQAQGIGSSALDCCLKNRPLKKEILGGVVTSYRQQGPESGCYLRSVVLITKRNRKICASPTDDTVLKLIQQLDKRAKNDKNRKKGQTQRPRGRPKKQRRQRV
ncbi:C-C motif chemokine 16-like [Ammospiza nelsoni]|uniref:C-C motif chemokine 16-like n=1 Tax=Ammospiza caudacuta TaxID=2857398 RepID=UPI00273A02FE|nr:C-C motif chemokine 16-like [Ammospiza caudacuta]XP_059347808.1 C-C motif chemokine 16-like [Ammospiza nelsoni]